MNPEAWIALGLALASAIVWLVRLEGRTNTVEKTHAADMAQAKLDLARAEADIAKAEREMHTKVATVEARQAADAATHGETAIALVRMEEQLKYLTGLFERQFVSPRATPRSPK